MFTFGPFSFDHLAQPWWLLLIPFAVVLLVLELPFRPAGSVSISTAHVFRRMGTSTLVRLRFIPPLLRFLGLALLIVALAGPMSGYQVRKNRANVISIMLAVDTSGSMQFEDFSIGGRSVDRLEVAKEAVRDFMGRRKGGEHHRFGLDRLGLGASLDARFAWTQCP